MDYITLFSILIGFIALAIYLKSPNKSHEENQEKIILNKLNNAEFSSSGYWIPIELSWQLDHPLLSADSLIQRQLRFLSRIIISDEI